jgi:Asp-tRNA(Asn)/Glu-tRNA(Gln) amidotransferase B subunit
MRGKIIANFVINDLKCWLKKEKISIENCPLKPEVIGMLAGLVEKGLIDKKQMKKLAKNWFYEDLNK